MHPRPRCGRCGKADAEPCREGLRLAVTPIQPGALSGPPALALATRELVLQGHGQRQPPTLPGPGCRPQADARQARRGKVSLPTQLLGVCPVPFAGVPARGAHFQPQATPACIMGLGSGSFLASLGRKWPWESGGGGALLSQEHSFLPVDLTLLEPLVRPMSGNPPLCPRPPRPSASCPHLHVPACRPSPGGQPLGLLMRAAGGRAPSGLLGAPTPCEAPLRAA